MKKLLLLAFCCYLSAAVMAQSTTQTLTVKGMAIDSATNQPLAYVTASIWDTQTKQPVKSSLTKDDGSFELKNTAGKQYSLVLAFVGYVTKSLPLTQSGTAINLGRILLQPSSKQLKDVSVVAAKPLMKHEVDRISYDVAADPESKSLTALDMMRKVPLISVDASDNIKLKGSGNYKILVNGKESGLLAKNPSDVLRSMPGTNIQKIEVITTPPAKYDAEGLAGIINIITTKNIDQGYNLGVNTRYNTLWGPGVNLNGTVKEGKLGFSGYTGLGRQITNPSPYTNTQNFFGDNSVLSQNGSSEFGGHYKYFSGEFSYEIDSLNLITGSVDLNSNFNSQEADGYTQTDSAGTVTQRYRQTTSSNNKNVSTDIAINYQLGFKKSKDQLLTLSYKYSYSPNTQFADDRFSDRLNYSQAAFPDFIQNNNAGNREHTVQVDYAQPFKKLSLEAGGKAIFRNNFSTFSQDTLSNITHQYILNPSQTNDFNYHQNVYSLYNSYQVKLTKWSAKAGLRLEETTVDANFISAGKPLNINYGNLIPSVSIQNNLSATSSINFGFTERIQRPNIYQLNPFTDNSNPQFINSGNPNLKPELNHVFELNYSYFTKGSTNVGLSYSFSNNSIQNVTSLRQDTTNGKPTTITYSTYQNLGSNKSLGLNLNANYSITPKFSININGELTHIWLKGYYNGSMYKNNGNLGNMFTSIAYKFDDGYRIGVNAGYFSGDVNLQGGSSYFIFNQYIISKELFNKNAGISLAVNNPYAKYWAGRSYTNTADFSQVSTYQQPYRSFMVRLSYKFGKLNSNIKKNRHGIENDDTKGGNKNNGNQ